ncbi:MAG: iron-sulfur cluster repair di-iron protein [Bacteroidetes bacterium]|nr:iron-sulfur cluster repair di-iron protein [Bacteroidota bacterium]
MIPSSLQTKSLKEIVTDNFHTAAVFEKYSLDFCCRGGKTIDEACKDKGIEPASVLNDLAFIENAAELSNVPFTEWEPDILCDYIVQNHHAYVAKIIPVLYMHTRKIAAVHGANHPELLSIAEHFEVVALELQQHMKKEEQMLFPFIKKIYAAKKHNEPAIHAPFGSVQNPILLMESEHENAGDEMYAIRSLSNNYSLPVDACTTYRVTFQELQEFELDLHRHVHLENNILFPKAIALEQEMISTN